MNRTASFFFAATAFVAGLFSGCIVSPAEERRDAGQAVDAAPDAGPPRAIDSDDDGFAANDPDPSRRDCDDADRNIHPNADVNLLRDALCSRPGFAGKDLNCDGIPDCPRACEAGQCCTAADCDDGDPCTGSVCTVDNRCVFIVAAPPPPGCAAPGCMSAADCADGDDCTRDLCLRDGTCRHDRLDGCVPACTSDAQCSDGLFCNGAERCVDGRCTAGAPPSCDDGVSCTVDTCSAALNHCVSRPDDSACGAREACNPVRGCEPTVECVADSDCPDDDGLFCTVASCDRGRCTFVPRNCDDHDPATADSCDEGANSCRNVPVPPACVAAACDDGLFCNGVERCNAAGACVAGTPPSCDDGDATTADSCDEAAARCRHVARPVEVCDGFDNDGDGVCDNGFACCRAAVYHCSYVGVDGRTVSGTFVCTDRCERGICSAPEECNGLDDNDNGLADETFACVRGRTVSCTFTRNGRSVTGTQTCGDTCTLGACQPPPEICGNGIDDNLDGNVDEGCGGGACVMPRTVRVVISGGSGAGRSLQSTFESANFACLSRWDTQRKVAPFDWSNTASEGVHLFNIYDDPGTYLMYTPSGVAGGTPAVSPGWSVQVDTGSGLTTPASFDGSRTTLPAGGTMYGRDRTGWANVVVCLGGRSCETNCSDGVDNDGDGFTDRADPDCGRIY